MHCVSVREVRLVGETDTGSGSGRLHLHPSDVRYKKTRLTYAEFVSLVTCLLTVQNDMNI